MGGRGGLPRSRPKRKSANLAGRASSRSHSTPAFGALRIRADVERIEAVDIGGKGAVIRRAVHSAPGPSPTVRWHERRGEGLTHVARQVVIRNDPVGARGFAGGVVDIPDLDIPDPSATHSAPPVVTDAQRNGSTPRTVAHTSPRKYQVSARGIEAQALRATRTGNRLHELPGRRELLHSTGFGQKRVTPMDRRASQTTRAKRVRGSPPGTKHEARRVQHDSLLA